MKFVKSKHRATLKNEHLGELLRAAFLRKNMTEPALIIYRDFMKSFFIRFWVEGQLKPRTTEPVMFAHLRSNVIVSVLCSSWMWPRLLS